MAFWNFAHVYGPLAQHKINFSNHIYHSISLYIYRNGRKTQHKLSSVPRSHFFLVGCLPVVSYIYSTKSTTQNVFNKISVFVRYARTMDYEWSSSPCVSSCGLWFFLPKWSCIQPIPIVKIMGYDSFYIQMVSAICGQFLGQSLIITLYMWSLIYDGHIYYESGPLRTYGILPHCSNEKKAGEQYPSYWILFSSFLCSK